MPCRPPGNSSLIAAKQPSGGCYAKLIKLLRLRGSVHSEEPGEAVTKGVGSFANDLLISFLIKNIDTKYWSATVSFRESAVTEKSVSDDQDPGAPQRAVESLFEDGVRRANLGTNEADGSTEGGVEGLQDFGHPGVLVIDIAKAHAFLTACMTSTPRVRYGLGAKAKPGAVPGRDFQAIDCSGFVRETIRRSTDLGNTFPDGSVVQHDWVKGHDFVEEDRSVGTMQDGVVRIAFLDPHDSGEGIGHVVLLHNGKTLESHGGGGPDERNWTVQGWQAKASVYRLS
jgi:hypothetical protein